MPYNIYYLDDNEEFLDLVMVATQYDKRLNITGFTKQSDLDKALKENIPDALIIDLNLGLGLTGTILASKYRLDHPSLPIAIYTSYDTLRAQELVYTKDLTTKMTQVWNKSDLNIVEIGDHIVELAEIHRGDSHAVQIGETA